jgi:hypothetical protein
MQPVLIGYFPLRTERAPFTERASQDWLQASNVVEICSAGCCGSEPPEGWIEKWRHNAMLVFNTEALAWSVVEPELRANFDMYAYRVFPTLHVDGERQSLELPELAVDQLPTQFRVLGFDAVSFEHFGTDHWRLVHSPLSCNGKAAKLAVNRYCLFDDLDATFELAAPKMEADASISSATAPSRLRRAACLGRLQSAKELLQRTKTCGLVQQRPMPALWNFNGRHRRRRRHHPIDRIFGCDIG